MQYHASSSKAGKLVSEMRKRRKLTQQQLADRVGMGRGSIANIESGEDKVSLTTLEKICEELGFCISLTVVDQIPYCQACGTTKNLHRDYGSGGPYRCDSPDCMVF